MTPELQAKLERIARVAYAAERAHLPGRPAWRDAPEETRDSVVDRVSAIAETPADASDVFSAVVNAMLGRA